MGQDQAPSRARRNFAAGAAAVAGACATFGLIGWATGVQTLRSGPFDDVEMRFNTALAMLVGASALWLLATERSFRLALGMTAAVAAFSAVVLAQYGLGVSLGIDQLLVGDPGGPDTVHPGRMSPQSALSIFVLGVSVVGAATGRLRGSLVESLCIAVAAVCLAATIGHLYGGGALTAIASFDAMSLPTAVALLALSGGVAAYGAGDRGLVAAMAGAGAGDVVARRSLISLVFVVPFVGWLRLAGQNAGFFDTETASALFSVFYIAILTAGILYLVRPLNAAAQTEDRMVSMEQQLGAIVSATGEAIMSLDGEGRIASWSAGAERLYGRSQGEMLGVPLADLTPPSGMDIEFSISPLLDTRGDITGSAVVARDRTEHTLEKQGMAEAREMAERANRATSEFVSRMSHELRTPLNAILGFGQLLEMDELSKEQDENVDYILKAGRHLLGLIDEVLQVSRIDAGAMTISPEPVNAAAAIEEVLGMIAPLAASANIRVTADLSPLQGVHVRADHQRLKQVLLNLLSNAVKYNRPRGSIEIDGVLVGDRLRLNVSDTGLGIAPAELPRLFTPFDRLGAEQGTVEGTGLGLALSRRLVDLMGGSLDVESECGAGSTFTVALPTCTAPGEAETSESVGWYSGYDARPLTVVHIEDNLSNLRLVERILGRRPHIQLLPAIQGRMGIDLAHEHSPDLILLDLHLPDLPGETVLRRLRADPETASIPVVVLSADATPSQVERLHAAGAHAYLTKPLNIRDFLQVLDETIGTTEVTA